MVIGLHNGQGAELDTKEEEQTTMLALRRASDDVPGEICLGTLTHGFYLFAETDSVKPF